MRLAICFFSFCLLTACSKHPSLERLPEQNYCPDSTFEGIGTGSSEGEALINARADMAQKHFPKKFEYSIKIEGMDKNGVAEFNTLTRREQEVFLINPKYAKLYYSKKQGNTYNVIVCMNYANAAKSFAERQQAVADSLELVYNVMRKIHNPLQKNDMWQRTQLLWGEFMSLQNFLDDFGVERADLFFFISEIYSKAKEEYIEYIASQNAKEAPEEADYAHTSQSKAVMLTFSFYKPEETSVHAYGGKEYLRNGLSAMVGIGVMDLANNYEVGIFAGLGSLGSDIMEMIAGFDFRASNRISRIMAIPVSFSLSIRGQFFDLEEEVIEHLAREKGVSRDSIDGMTIAFNISPAIDLEIFASKSVSLYAGYMYRFAWPLRIDDLPDEYNRAANAKQRIFGVPGTLRFGLRYCLSLGEKT